MPHITSLQPSGRARKRFINARIDLLVAERKVTRRQAERAKKGEDALLQFAARYNLSLDWLVIGDLRGLKWMTRNTK